MQASRPPAGQADVPSPAAAGGGVRGGWCAGRGVAAHQPRQSAPASGPVGPDTQRSSDEEFLVRFGDAIDDRIAEIVDELLDERDARREYRPARYISAASVVLAALVASVLLQHSPIVWAIWPSAAAVSLAAAWTARIGRP
jgi:hypothetical protein